MALDDVYFFKTNHAIRKLVKNYVIFLQGFYSYNNKMAANLRRVLMYFSWTKLLDKTIFKTTEPIQT